MEFELTYTCMHLAFQVPISGDAVRESVFVKFTVTVCFCGFSFNLGGGGCNFTLWVNLVTELEKEYVYTVYEKSDIKRNKDALLRYKQNNTE